MAERVEIHSSRAAGLSGQDSFRLSEKFLGESIFEDFRRFEGLQMRLLFCSVVCARAARR